VSGAYVLDGATEAMVASLESQKERERLTRFLTLELQDGKGTGILGDVFLLLKANRCFMEKLPAQFNRELVQPIQEQALRMEKTFSLQSELQQKAMAQDRRTTEASFRTMEHMEAIAPKVQSVVQNSFDQIDTKKLSHTIAETLEKAVIAPVAKTNSELQRTVQLLGKLIDHVRGIFDLLKDINIYGMLAGCFALAFVVCGLISYFAIDSAKHSYEDTVRFQEQKLQAIFAEVQKVQAAPSYNGDAFEKLRLLQIPITVEPAVDGQGQTMDGRYTLSLAGAENAQLLQPNSEGVITFSAIDLGTMIKRQIQEQNKLLGH
jgi:hypothetical protein